MSAELIGAWLILALAGAGVAYLIAVTWAEFKSLYLMMLSIILIGAAVSWAGWVVAGKKPVPTSCERA